jgi:hypothetical protein
VYANNKEFPISHLAKMLQGGSRGGSKAAYTDDDLRRMSASAMGIFGTLVGTLQTHNGSAVIGQQLHQIATGLMHPSRGYDHGFNFFDPDSYIATSALLLAGSPYINEQVPMCGRLAMIWC